MLQERGDTRLTGLDKNIGYIVARTAQDYGVSNKELDAHILKLTKNFYSEMGHAIALESLNLYRKHKDRELTHSFLLIAYDIEINWRAYRQEDALLQILANPHSVEPCEYRQLLFLKRDEESLLYHRLKSLKYTDYLFTSYWRAIRSEVLRMHRHSCTRCDSQQNLQVHHRSYEGVYKDHLYLHNLEVLCGRCHGLEHNVTQKP